MAKSTEDVLLKLLFSFWLVEREVHQGFLVLWLAETEGGCISGRFSLLWFTVINVHERLNQELKITCPNFTFILLLSWTSKEGFRCCRGLQFEEGCVWSTGPRGSVCHASWLGERLKLYKVSADIRKAPNLKCNARNYLPATVDVTQCPQTTTIHHFNDIDKSFYLVTFAVHEVYIPITYFNLITISLRD